MTSKNLRLSDELDYDVTNVLWNYSDAELEALVLGKLNFPLSNWELNHHILLYCINFDLRNQAWGKLINQTPKLDQLIMITRDSPDKIIRSSAFEKLNYFTLNNWNLFLVMRDSSR